MTRSLPPFPSKTRHVRRAWDKKASGLYFVPIQGGPLATTLTVGVATALNLTMPMAFTWIRVQQLPTGLTLATSDQGVISKIVMTSAGMEAKNGNAILKLSLFCEQIVRCCPGFRAFEP